MKHSNWIGGKRVAARVAAVTLITAIMSLGVSILAPSEVTADAYVIQETIVEHKSTPNVSFTVHVDNSGVETEIAEPTISADEERQLQEELIVESREEEFEAYINSIYCDPNDVTKITNLKLEDMPILTDGTWWEGYEESLYHLEQNYGINAVFAMAVSTLESGGGTSSRARNRDNYYGLSTSTNYGSRYSCTMYFGDLINRKYVSQGRSSVYSIGPKYCPPNRQWESYMAEYMSGVQSQLRSEIASRGISTI